MQLDERFFDGCLERLMLSTIKKVDECVPALEFTNVDIALMADDLAEKDVEL